MKFYIFFKNCNFKPFFCLIKNMLCSEKRTHVNKGCNLLNFYLLMVLLSIPFNKLPWIQEQAASETILLVLIKVEAEAFTAVTEVVEVEVWLLVVWTLIWQLCEQAPKLQGFSSVQSCSSELSPQLSKVSQTNFSSMHLPKIEIINI